MSELTPLREAVDALAGRSPVPDFETLQARATRRGRRRVATVAAAVAGTVAVVVTGGGLALGGLGGDGQPSPADEPAAPSSSSRTVEDTAESPDCSDDESPSCQASFDRRLDAILGDVPGWTVDEPRPSGGTPDLVINGPCEGNWGLDGATGAGHGSAGTAEGGLAQGLYHARWPSRAQAADAADRLVENLASCDRTAWRTRTLAQRPGAVLAFSPEAVVWIQQSRSDVWVLQVLSNGEPPPPEVQAAVADWMVDYIDWKWVD